MNKQIIIIITHTKESVSSLQYTYKLQATYFQRYIFMFISTSFLPEERFVNFHILFS